MIECSNGALELNSSSMIFQSKIKTTGAALKSLMFLLAKKKIQKTSVSGELCTYSTQTSHIAKLPQKPVHH